WKSGKKVWEFEVKWDSKSQYPPFGDTKPERFIDIDLLVQTQPAHDGKNLYFAANNGVVYAVATQENIAKPRKNLAILGSGIVPFIPKWTEALGAFDYVWTPEGDWYNPGYSSPNSITANQAPPGFTESTTPFGYKGVATSSAFPTVALLVAIALGILALHIKYSRDGLIPVDPWGFAKPATSWARRERKLMVALLVVVAVTLALMSSMNRFSPDSFEDFSELPLHPASGR
ncbi:MAG: hypothetical protein ABIS18_06870, partial [Actinomycetota bacterium]